MSTKNLLLIAGAGVLIYFIWKKSKPSVVAKTDSSNASGSAQPKLCRCRNALGGYTDVPCPCPAPQSIFK